MEDEEIRKAIISMVEGLIPLNSTWCKVKSIENQTCTIIVDDLEIDEILLGFDKSGIIVYPKVNSDVLVCFIDNTKTNGAVVIVKETEKIEILGNQNGGIALTEKVAERLKRVEDAFFNLQTKFNQHLTLYNTHIHSGGVLSGSTGPTAPDVNTSTENVSPRTTQDIISNSKVKHGNG